ncbi:hypothetical protein F4560_003965 [Saccharothrix ecbatanensis]|jgi:hypothetical protein|uniref:DUF4240 domain-containing protein n=1 Tax=Saccharothrix ecbatanensis TaxID=1105145 RepID=A0A7W9HKX5_9PSEU|nr:DUF4240 domain-containing protein [Saccharothrix ecbatanensis]MBB5804197.1 hypothetical protein [Saccharothrix ecbatanensis]
MILPTAAEEARFWALLENAWAGLGPEPNGVRRALAGRDVSADAFEEATELEEHLDRVLATLADECAGLSAEELIALDRVVERKLHEIDRADVHEVTEGSDDGFLYARGFIVAMGREFYEAVSRDPRVAIGDAEGEAMCYFFARVHADRFGDYPETGSGISRESGTNRGGWADLEVRSKA